MCICAVSTPGLKRGTITHFRNIRIVRHKIDIAFPYLKKNQSNFVSQSQQLHEPPGNSAHIECIQPIVLGSNHTNYALTIINPTIFNVIRWLAGSMEPSAASDVPSIILTLYFNFCKITKNKNVNSSDFCKKFCKKLQKKITLGTSDTWLMTCLSQRPSVLY